MSMTLPETVDAWRMVSTRRSFQGVLPVARLKRLGEVLADSSGEVDYTLDFDRDELGTAYLAVHAHAPLTLLCQRTLEPFVLPVTLDTRLGLISDDSEEAALPPGYEPLLVVDDRVDLAAVMEDELLLAVPLVPVSPQSEWPDEGKVAKAPDAPEEPKQDNPFAVLRELKRK
ncbi:MAG TPA: YceD family protein [Oleiagrimonas sp.]|nr:YceD family protein [Oleiagrimonas sp.]